MPVPDSSNFIALGYAKELGIDNKDLITRLEKLGIAVKAHSSSLEDSDVERVRQEFVLGEKNAIVEKRVKTTIIRRRAIRQEVPEIEESQDETQPEMEPQETTTETQQAPVVISDEDTPPETGETENPTGKLQQQPTINTTTKVACKNCTGKFPERSRLNCRRKKMPLPG